MTLYPMDVEVDQKLPIVAAAVVDIHQQPKEDVLVPILPATAAGGDAARRAGSDHTPGRE